MLWIGLALALAAIGLTLVGLVAYRVWQRTRELSRAVSAASGRLESSLAALQDVLGARDVP